MTLLKPCPDGDTDSGQTRIDKDFTALRGLWASVRATSADGVVRRTALDVVRLSPYMANLALVEDTGEGLRFRLAGAGIERFYNHGLHKAMAATRILGPEADTLAALTDQVWQLGLPVTATAEYRTAHGRLAIHRLLLPLAPSTVSGARLALVAEYVTRPREEPRTHRPPVLDPATRQMFITEDPWSDGEAWSAAGQGQEEVRRDMVRCVVHVIDPGKPVDASPVAEWVRCRVATPLKAETAAEGAPVLAMT